MSDTKKTPEEMLKDLEKLKAELGREPTIMDMRGRKDIAKPASYRQVFGSLKKAFDQLETGSRVVFKKSKKDVLFDAFLAQVDELGHMISKIEIDHIPTLKGYDEYIRVFGSWQPIKAKMHILRPKINTKLTRESLLSDLRFKFAEVGRPLSSTDISTDVRISHYATYSAKFGSLKKACKLAGVPFEPLVKHNTYTDEQLLDFVRQKAAELNRQPMCIDIRSDPCMPDCNTITKRFGCSWSEIIVLAGVAHLPTLKNRKSDLESKKIDAIKRLQEFAEKLGHTPSSVELNSNNITPSATLYINLFGSMRSAIEAAGLKPKQRRSKPSTGP